MKKLGSWLDNMLPNKQEKTKLQELEIKDEEYNPERDLEEQERLLEEDSDEEQEQDE